jgi:hypothetical protein
LKYHRGLFAKLTIFYLSSSSSFHHGKGNTRGVGHRCTRGKGVAAVAPPQGVARGKMRWEGGHAGGKREREREGRERGCAYRGKQERTWTTMEGSSPEKTNSLEPRRK